jgi:hypothetical protein
MRLVSFYSGNNQRCIPLVQNFNIGYFFAELKHP